MCQYIVSTRLSIFEAADSSDSKEEFHKEIMSYIRKTQEPDKEKKKGAAKLAERRMTVSGIQKAHQSKNADDGEVLDLGKQFKVKFAGRASLSKHLDTSIF